jgi:TP901 family phage tail tape measure protein
MANDTSLTFSLYGKDVSASKALKDIGDSAEKTGGMFSQIKTVAAGVFAGNILENAAGKALSFAKDSINAFQDVGKEVRLLQRYTGDSAESMSQLRFAAEESGVSAETLAAALGKMSKAAAASTADKTFGAIGVAVQDANGHLRSSSAIFDDVVAKLGAMKNGTEKTADIMKIFGRSGMEIAPLLNQGAEGMAKFKEEAQKFGLVMSQDSLNAVKDNVMAQREFHAAVQGVQVQLGQYLYPAITTVMKAFSEIVPVIGTLLKPAFEVIGVVLKPVIQIIGELGSWITKLTSGLSETSKAGGGLNGIFSALSPIATDIKNIFSELGKVFTEIILPILGTLWEFISKFIIPLFEGAFKLAVNNIKTEIHLLADVIQFVGDLFIRVKDVAIFAGDTIKNVFGAIVDVIKGTINGLISLINSAIRAINSIHVTLPSWLGGKTFGVNIPQIPMLAEGGIVTSPTIAMIGEAGPEAVVPLNKGFGTGINVVVNVQGSVVQEQDLAVSVRDQIAILMRRRGLNPAILGV